MIFSGRISFWQIFRLIFVIFSLYLLGDAFYRWDGFRYYASFKEFLPSLALAHVLWSILAAFTAFGLWILYKAIEGFYIIAKLKFEIERLLFFLIVSVLLGVIVWTYKKYYLPFETSLETKTVVLFSIIFSSLFISWLFRNKSGKWMRQISQWINVIQERITPLIWIFSILAILSVPLLAYEVWFKQPNYKTAKTFAPSSATGKKQPNILLLTFDALSAKDMSVYGYHRQTTPFISKLSKTSALFTRVYSAGNYTAPTTASLMTGKRIWTHQRLHPHGNPPLKSESESLPLLLKNNGYYNMAFIVNFIASVDELGITNSFILAPPSTEFISANSLLGAIDVTLDRFFGHSIKLNDWILKEDFVFYKIINVIQPILDQLQQGSMTEMAPEIAFNKFLTVLDNRPPQPFFVWIHLLPPHSPYLPPDPFMGMFNSSSKLRTASSQSRILTDFLQVDTMRSEFQMPKYVEPEIYEIFRARYDEFILYCDKQFENFMTELSMKNILDNTVVILSADHGDIFRPPFLTHGNSLYDPELHIPLMIKEPDHIEGKVINALVEQIDIPATILDLAHIPIPSWMEGRSLVPYLRGGLLTEKPVFSMDLKYNQLGHQITKAFISVWEGDYKLIHFLEKKESLLFNLKNDPEESVNLINREVNIGQHLLTLIDENLQTANERIRKEQ